MTVGRKGANIYIGGCAIAWAFISTIFHLSNRNTSKVVQNRDTYSLFGEVVCPLGSPVIPAQPVQNQPFILIVELFPKHRGSF